jgi:uncharacterized membrane protein YdjX (TVP38/TMEM64 family)
MDGDKTVTQAHEGAAAPGPLRRYLPLAVLLALVVVAFAQGWHKYLTLDELVANRALLQAYVTNNSFVALASFALIYIAIVALSLPGGALATIAGGFLFGWMTAGFLVVVAATIGATILFLIAKTSLGEPLARRAGPWLGKLGEGFRADALNYLLFLRLVPIFPFWLVNLAPALLDVPLRTFVIGTFVGIIPGTFAFAFLGSGLDSVVEAQRQANPDCTPGALDCQFDLELSALVTSELLLALAALGCVALLPVVVKKLRANKGPAEPS